MVVVCTKNAAASPFVRDEVRLFGSLRRKVIPIDVEGSFYSLQNHADLWTQVGGEAPESETLEAIEAGNPSDQVLERILKAIEFVTQQQRLERLVWGTLALIGLIIGGASYYSRTVVKNANADVDRARSQAADARSQAEQANSEKNAAETERGVAETAAAKAEQDRTSATKAADIQRTLASALQLSSEQAQKRQQTGETTEQDVVQAINSAQLFLKAGSRAGAYDVLQQALNGFPVMQATHTLRPDTFGISVSAYDKHVTWADGGEGYVADFTPVGFTALHRLGEGAKVRYLSDGSLAIIADKQVWMRRPGSGAIDTFRIPEGFADFAWVVSRAGKYLAYVTHDGKLRLRDLSNGTERLLNETNPFNASLGFTPDESRLIFYDSKGPKALLTQTGETVTPKTWTDTSWRDVRLSPDGRFIAGEACESLSKVCVWAIYSTEKDAAPLRLTGIGRPTFSNDGRLVAASYIDRVEILETDKGYPVTTISNAIGSIIPRSGVPVCFSGDGRYFAVRSDNALTPRERWRVVSVATGSITATIPGEVIGLSDNGLEAIVQSEKGSVRQIEIWPTFGTVTVDYEFDPRQNPRIIRFSPSDTRLGVEGLDPTSKMSHGFFWDRTTGNQIAGPIDRDARIAVGDDSAVIIGDRLSEVESDSRKQWQMHALSSGPVEDAVWKRKDGWIALKRLDDSAAQVVSVSGQMKGPVCRLHPHPKPRFSLDGEHWGGPFERDGKRYFAVHDLWTGASRVYSGCCDKEDVEEFWCGDINHCLAIDSDHRDLWDLGKGKRSRDEPAYGQRILALSPDGRFAARSTRTGVDVWDIAQEQVVAEINLVQRLWSDYKRLPGGAQHSFLRREARFSGTGDLIAVTTDFDLSIWRWRTNDMIKEACLRLQNSMQTMGKPQFPTPEACSRISFPSPVWPPETPVSDFHDLLSHMD